MPTEPNSPARLRGLAQSYRAQARRGTVIEIKQQLLDLADAYERLAEEAEVLGKMSSGSRDDRSPGLRQRN
jgi:hypothetical protein